MAAGMVPAIRKKRIGNHRQCFGQEEVKLPPISWENTQAHVEYKDHSRHQVVTCQVPYYSSEERG